ELVEAAGGFAAFGKKGAHSPTVSWDELRRADPDVLVCMPCGFDVARAEKELPALASKPGWSDLSAVKGRRVFLVDGNAFFNRPGPRLVESAEILAELLHGLSYGHERAWKPAP